MQRDKILVIGENIKIRRFVRISDGVNVTYVHMGQDRCPGQPGGLGQPCGQPDSQGAGKDIAMQVAAMSPRFLSPDDVDSETYETEKQILMVQVMQEGKPEAIAEKIVAGKMNKFYEESCLLKQAFVKDSKQSVEKHIESVAKELGGSISVKRFVRFEKGEG